MYVNKKMKLNKFEQVSIPKNCDYFARIGNRVTPESAYSGEIPAEEFTDKLQSIADMDAYDKAMQAEELKKKKPTKVDE